MIKALEIVLNEYRKMSYKDLTQKDFEFLQEQ
jgi:hypothetical protein